jgi:hypothetical protein
MNSKAAACRLPLPQDVATGHSSLGGELAAIDECLHALPDKSFVFPNARTAAINARAGVP